MALKNKSIFSKISVASIAAMILVNQTGGVVHAASANLNKAFPVTYNPGHGGGDPGAIATNGLKEHDICTDISAGLKEVLDDFSIENASTGKSGASAGEKITLAKKLNSLNIDIHNNSAKSSTAKGFEVYVEDNSDKAFISGLKKTAESFCAKSRLENRGVKLDSSSQHSNLAMTYKSESSYGILIEIGFLSNPEEVKKVDTLEKRKMLGYLFGAELLVGFNVISREDADAKIKEAAIRYNFIKEDAQTTQETQITKENSVAQKGSLKNLSIEDLFERNKKLVNKLEKETLEIEQRVLERIETLNDTSVSEQVDSANNSTDKSSAKESDLGINPAVLKSINRLNNESADTSNSASTSIDKEDIEQSTNNSGDIDNSQNNAEVSNTENTDKSENIPDITEDKTSNIVENGTNESSDLSDVVLNNIDNLNNESLNNITKEEGNSENEASDESSNDNNSGASESKEGSEESSTDKQSNPTTNTTKSEGKLTDKSNNKYDIELNDTMLSNINALNEESSNSEKVDTLNKPSNTTTIPDFKLLPKEESEDELEDSSEDEE